ncbi:N-6 DNA methylase [Micrococcales bacterium 31B]|nr:N-6 DNA methylase [Micrococcales bacterium 31B]
MSSATPLAEDSTAAVNGLVDNRRAAALLGVSVNTFRVWANRSQTATSGIAAAMPTPIATMHGQVYRVEDIEEFGRYVALNSRTTRSAQRERGAYFTPGDAADVMVRWALRRSDDVVLEPSVGDGQFAIAAQRYAASHGWGRLDLHACELDPATASQAVATGAVDADRVHVGDFLAENRLPEADVVIGNPPYVRVREVSAPMRRNALRTAAKTMHGLDMDPAGSVWMPFVSKSASLLKPGGRLAFVLPLDFTYVRYARPLWDLLAKSFGRIRVLRFRERVFPDIMQNVLLLLAEDHGGSTAHAELVAHDRLADLPEGIGDGVRVPILDVIIGHRSFQHALLPAETTSALEMLRARTHAAQERVKFNIGYVSGNKGFFHPSAEAQKLFHLPKSSLHPTVESSRQLTSAGLATSSMTLAASLWLPNDKLTKGEQDYVTQGVQDEVDMGYKCRIRSPWYRVPGVRAPELFLTTFSDRPRLYLNDAGWYGSNSVLCGYIRADEDPVSVVGSWYTPLTLLSTELQIHSLGGGVMIAVPREADSVRILDRDSTLPVDSEALDAALRSRDSNAAYELGAESIRKFVGSEGLDAIQAGADVLTKWRKAQA